jgi:serine/threonine protein kinase
MGLALTIDPTWIEYDENSTGRKLPIDPSELLEIPGEQITKYHGQGTIGIVVGNDNWAYKILSPLEKATKRLIERGLSLEDIFAKEGQMAVLSNHIVPRSYHQTKDGVPYIKMRAGEPISSEDLTIDPLKLVSHVGQGIADYQEATGNVYYDIKLENIIKYNNNFLITDFSTPTICEESGNDGKVRQNIGSMYTRAPEVYGEENKPMLQSDVFGLGSLLMKALTGSYITENEIDSCEKNPDVMKNFYEQFDSKSWDKFIEKKLGLRGKLPFGIIPIIKKALAINPEERYQNAQKFMNAIIKHKQEKKWSHGIASLSGLSTYAFMLSMLFSSGEYRHQQPVSFEQEADVVILSSNFGPKFHYENIEREGKSSDQVGLILPEGNFNNFIEKYDHQDQVLSPFLYGLIQSYDATKRDDRSGSFFIEDPELKIKSLIVGNCLRAGCRKVSESFSDMVLPDSYQEGDGIMPQTLEGIQDENSNPHIFKGYRGDSNVYKITQQIYSKISPNGGTVDLEDLLVEVALGPKSLKKLKMKANSDYYEDYKDFIYPDQREFIEIWLSTYLDSLKGHTKKLEIYDKPVEVLSFNGGNK